MTKTDERKLLHQEAVLIWEGFCTLHRDLYDLTCDEYLTLLASDIDKLEGMLPLKEAIIADVDRLESRRTSLIERINAAGVTETSVLKAGDLLEAFREIDSISGIPVLRNLNALLIDIVEKIQEQNKKNQLYLNKAMISLRDIKQSFDGRKTYTTYGSDGLTRSAHK